VIDDKVFEAIAPYRKKINKTPALLSLLYDADLMPEQISTMRGALSLAAVVEAYDAGRRDLASESRQERVMSWFDRFLSWLYIRRLWGPRCSDYQEGCACCEHWKEHDEVIETLPRQERASDNSV